MGGFVVPSAKGRTVVFVASVRSLLSGISVLYVGEAHTVLSMNLPYVLPNAGF